MNKMALEHSMIAEPMFQEYDAKIEFHPVMVFNDLKKAISKKK
jgi:hypothetical protein